MKRNIYKILSILGFLLFLSNISFSQSKVYDENTLQEILNYSKENSVMKDSVNWDTITSNAFRIHKSDGIIGASQYILKSLNDFHGRIWYNNIPYNGLIKPYVPTQMKMDSTVIAQYRQTKTPIIGELIDSSFGYIRIPGLVFGKNDSLNAHTIHNIIYKLEQKHKTKGWIVDLRLNGGGTMYPMLSGLNSLLGTSPLGSFIDPASNFKQNWTIEKGEVFVDTFKVTDYKLTKLIDLSQKPVVVLISAATSSSGEVVALAFQKRKQTYFIGEETAGYTTSVSWHELENGMIYQLTESWYADREDNIYFGEPVKPDFYMAKENDFNNLSNDKWIKKAIEILSNE